jgi:hypothetical protein
MGDIDTILKDAIVQVAGNEGLQKFTKTGYGTATHKIIHPDGSLDLPRLMNLMLGIFPEGQASAITDNVLSKYAEISNKAQTKEQATIEAESNIVASGLKYKDSYENDLAEYLESDESDMRDLINEARRIRMAMGRADTAKAAMHAETTIPEPSRPTVSIVTPIVERAYETLDTELKTFVSGKNSYSSVEIMDFIRYLKDKGYQFQENNILEKVYTRLEERKNIERTSLMADIHSFLATRSWPGESEVSAYIESKRSEGIICDTAEIKRMILIEMIRRN